MTTGTDLPDFVTYKIYTNDKVNSILSATLQHLDSEQIVALRDSLIERTPSLASEELAKNKSVIDMMNKMINKQIDVVKERNEELARLKEENERLRAYLPYSERETHSPTKK